MPDATNSSPGTIDPKSGFCSKTGIFHSLRSPVPLPPLSAPLSTTDFLFSLLNHHLSSSLPPSPTVALLDAFTLRHISFHDLILRTNNLISSLRHRLRLRLRKGDTVFVLSPNSLHIPILYLSLLSLGVVISPSNPASSESEILHQVRLSKPVTAFATSASLHKLPHSLKPSAIILDSPEFELLMTSRSRSRSQNEREKETEFERDTVFQSDPAAILYSSGTTGRVKGVILTHRNFISNIASALAVSTIRETPAVHLCTVPYFHVYGFVYCLRAAAMGETMVSFERFDLQVLLRAIQEFRVTHMAVAPPVVTRMIKSVGVVKGYDLSSLEVVACGGSALRNSVVEVFKEQFPNILLAQAYGLTESTARVFATSGPTECSVVGATGKLIPNSEAKIVDPETGISLAPNNRGELWVRGASVMKGYLGDEVATAATLDSEGWLRTGDICCINDEGFLFFVDRMKELIKCRGYQVAPAELEHLLQSHPDIDEAAVVPYPDDEAGQLPVAFVVRQTGSIISESDIKDFIAPLVAPYKRIHKVIFIDSLPRNAAGKVLRKELIKLATAGARAKL